MKTRTLPKTLETLNSIAGNYWWSWNQESWKLFEQLNPKTWAETRNPVLTLLQAEDSAINKLSEDKGYLGHLEWVTSNFNNYLNRDETWFSKNHSSTATKENPIAYFSAEFGIHEALPIYSGGLGVLAGDHVKSSSDLGIPMAFVGLFYKNGYFTQQIDGEGQQVDVYGDFDAEELSLTRALDKNGKEVLVEVSLPERKVSIKVWKAMVGQNPLYLLDTNLPENSKEDQDLTARLYGGDREMRMSQEIVLGIGGVKVLAAMGVTPSVWHMNEGHSGFFQLERTKRAMEEHNLNFEEAKIFCASNCLFTTHTPVPAGNESFSLPVMHKYFHEYIKELDISWHRFINLGLVDEKTDHKFFSLTVFALNFSRFHNGVSELHGRIAAKMWKKQWPEVPEMDNPISHVTNGVHVQTWTSLEMKNMYREFMGGDWEDQLANHSWWEKAHNIPNTEMKKTKIQLKNKMISMVRTQLKEQLKRNGESQDAIAEVDNYLSENCLTVGFARRFATYKRATLIFKDLDKLESLVNDPNRPVQFIFAGKAHPADIPGQTFIKEIYQISRTPRFRGKVIILENYDMNISRHMVSGVDVWLNNPRRPMEASGTSGQKVPLNAGLNFSVLDGWWREGFNGQNGWTIGEEKDYPNDDIQDFEDAHDFYRTLGETIVPLYYNGKFEDGVSDAWIDKCKESIVSNISHFSTQRMVQDYMNEFYTKAWSYGESFRENELSKVKSYIEERRFLQRNWPVVTLNSVQISGAHLDVASDFEAMKDTPSHHVEYPKDASLPGRVIETVESDIEFNAYLGDISPEQVKAELVISDGVDNITYSEFSCLNRDQDGTWKFKTQFKSPDGKPRRLRVRMYPTMDHLASKFEFSTCSWL
ncbi:MAG: alpha-glucan family phosphorylase [Bacteriovoracaceae bacterium]|nr:alpha-glucan family phosphorylase [Bacteriovoracaceae bacterium]